MVGAIAIVARRCEIAGLGAERTMIPDVIAPLPATLAEALRDVEPSIVPHWLTQFPCEVILDDGSVHSRVILVEAHSYHSLWGVWPWEHGGNGSWVPIERVRSLRSSPVRVPARFANVLNEAGESGMGYCAFSLELTDGRRLHYVTGNLVDYVNWPEDVSPADVVGVTPHDRNPEWRDRPRRLDEGGAGYEWCLFTRNSD